MTHMDGGPVRLQDGEFGGEEHHHHTRLKIEAAEGEEPNAPTTDVNPFDLDLSIPVTSDFGPTGGVFKDVDQMRRALGIREE